MLRKLSTIRFKNWGFPLVILALCILAFGLLIPELGFYWDDWEPVQVLKLYGISHIWDYFRGDRPFSGWTYAVFAPLVGTSVIGWQILSLLFRYGSSLAMWWLLNLTWPKNNNWNALAATPPPSPPPPLCIYPIFRQQPIAVSYHQHWLGYLLILLSMCFMILSIRKPDKKWGFLTASILTQILHLAIFEYFIGLEFLRPVLLFLVLNKTSKPNKKNILHILKIWLPYLVIDAAFIIWRIFFAEAVEGVNETILLTQFFSNPLSALISLGRIILQDMIHFFYTVWQDLLSPALLDNFSLSKMFFFMCSRCCRPGCADLFFPAGSYK